MPSLILCRLLLLTLLLLALSGGSFAYAEEEEEVPAPPSPSPHLTLDSLHAEISSLRGQVQSLTDILSHLSAAVLDAVEANPAIYEEGRASASLKSSAASIGAKAGRLNAEIREDVMSVQNKFASDILGLSRSSKEILSRWLKSPTDFVEPSPAPLTPLALPPPDFMYIDTSSAAGAVAAASAMLPQPPSPNGPADVLAAWRAAGDTGSYPKVKQSAERVHQVAPPAVTPAQLSLLFSVNATLAYGFFEKVYDKPATLHLTQKSYRPPSVDNSNDRTGQRPPKCVLLAESMPSVYDVSGFVPTLINALMQHLPDLEFVNPTTLGLKTSGVADAQPPLFASPWNNGDTHIPLLYNAHGVGGQTGLAAASWSDAFFSYAYGQLALPVDPPASSSSSPGGGGGGGGGRRRPRRTKVLLLRAAGAFDKAALEVCGRDHTVVITGTTSRLEDVLIYREWVESRRGTAAAAAVSFADKGEGGKKKYSDATFLRAVLSYQKFWAQHATLELDYDFMSTASGLLETSESLVLSLCILLLDDGDGCPEGEAIVSEARSALGNAATNMGRIGGSGEDSFGSFKEKFTSEKGWHERARNVRDTFAAFISKFRRDRESEESEGG